MAALVHSSKRGVDFSFARPPANRLVELGFTFIVGYISVPPASPKKNITKAECEAYLDAGLKVLLVWEMDAVRPNKGATYGAIDGKNAARRADELGYPLDVPILSAADLNTFAANIESHEAYMRAFAATCGPRPMGIYGDTDILARTQGLWEIGWVPVGAWAWSGTSYANAIAKARALGAHVLQRKGFHIDNQWAVDPNDAIAPFPAWSALPDPVPAPWPPPDPPPLEDEMSRALLNCIDAGTLFWAEVDAGGTALRCWWTGPGTDSNVAAAIAGQLGAPGTVSKDVQVANLSNVYLDGPMPEGGTYQFVPEDFANAWEIRERLRPTAAVDEQARTAVEFVRAEQGALDARFDQFLAKARAAFGEH